LGGQHGNEKSGGMKALNSTGKSMPAVLVKIGPQEIKDQYRGYILNINYDHAVRNAHEKIHQLHRYLGHNKIPHIFFNTFEPFTKTLKFEWGNSYIHPYNPEYTYYNWLKQRGFKTVRPGSYHFGPDAHTAWAEFLYQNYVQTLLTT
jgi:hypothetical protein